jgi:subtilisin family serine protease
MTHLAFHKVNNLLVCISVAMFASSLLVGAFNVSNLRFAAKNVTDITALQKISADLLEETRRAIRDNVDILIETFDADYSTIKADVIRLGGRVRFEYKHVSGLAVTLPANNLLELARNSNVKKIYLDSMRYPSINYFNRFPVIDGFESPFLFVDRNVFDKHQSFDVVAQDKNLIPEVDCVVTLEDDITITLTSEQIALLEPSTYWGPVAMGAVGAWTLGDYGQNSLVVVIDTGIYAEHFMLKGSVIGGIDISPDVGTEYEGWNLATNHWHGTHVAGIIAGHGAILVHASDPLYRSISMYATPPQEASSFGYPGYYIIPLLGLAPRAQLYAIKVFPHTGAGVSESIIIEAIEYAIDLKLEQGYDVDVISMSLGGPTTFDGRDLEDQVVDYASEVGITVVAAAGNEGPASMTVSSPGSAESAITVAAAAHPVNTRVFWDIYYGKQGIGWQLYVSNIPQIYAFSSRGPTSDGRDKPDIAATGLFVLSAYNEPNWPQGLAFASGTSMATPAVSGAVALLNTYAEMSGIGASPLDYKQAVKNGAVWLDGYGKYDQGAGYLNAYNALIALVNDPSIGDVYPPLPEEYELFDISNIPIFETGVYEGAIVGLKPGLKQEFIFKVTEATDSITLTITDVTRNRRNPYDMNSFEVYMQSAKRTMYGYWIESANVWGDAKFVITDYGVTWTGRVTGVYYDESTWMTAIEPGFVKIVIENDWTSSGPLSCKFKIEVTAKPAPPANKTYTGTITQDEWIRVSTTGYIIPPPGTTKVVIELWWQNDWSKYPTNDLDMYVRWHNGTTWQPWVYDGATLNSPERVVIEAPTIATVYVYINGYSVHTDVESWILKIYFS